MGHIAGPLSGRRALVTGAGTGIGSAIALQLARDGASVAVHYSHSEAGARRVVDAIAAAGGTALALAADFTSLVDVRRLAGEAVSFLGGLDILVNNAGITLNLPFTEVAPDQFDVVYSVNVRSPYFLTQALLPALEADGGGAVLNLTSVHALAGFPGHSVYAGTKGAIVAHTRELAIELAPRGVRVNAIAPGAVPVENHARIGADTDPDALGRLIPAGFAGSPEDVAGLASFLVSDAARYIVGQTIVMDGGTTAWLAFSDAFRAPSDVPFGRGYVPGV
jgi:glucose 1-dehydrogenase